MTCPKCKGELIKRESCFFLPEVGKVPGLICTKCGVLFVSEEFISALDSISETSSESAPAHSSKPEPAA